MEFPDGIIVIANKQLQSRIITKETIYSLPDRKNLRNNYMSAEIFINYRISDSRFEARGLGTRLKEALGEQSVFVDTEDIQGGEKWSPKLKKAVKAAKVVLSIIGPKWLTASIERNGKRRLLLSTLRNAVRY